VAQEVRQVSAAQQPPERQEQPEFQVSPE